MPDILIVSLGSTAGLRAADEELRASLERAGASVELVSAKRPREVRTLMLTDLVWARAARKAAREGLRRHSPRAVIYSSTTAALLGPRGGAIRFDAPATGNRPGRHGLWQRPVERRRLAKARLLLPWSEGGLAEVPRAVRGRDRVFVLRVPVESSGHGGERPSGPSAVEPSGGEPSGSDNGEPLGGGWEERDIAAITYGANPAKKGLARVLEAWEGARRPGEELVIAGVAAEDLAALGFALPSEGVRVTGLLPAPEYRALLRRSRVFVCAPTREDYGLAQLEALADGCKLVTTAAPGPYAALPIARALDRYLVGEELGPALRAALDEPLGDYPERAQEALMRFSRATVDRVVAEEVLPRLLGGGSSR